MTNIEDKIKENWLRCFGHVQRQGISELGKDNRKLELRRLKKRTSKIKDDLEDMSANDMNDLDIQIKMVEN